MKHFHKCLANNLNSFMLALVDTSRYNNVSLKRFYCCSRYTYFIELWFLDAFLPDWSNDHRLNLIMWLRKRLNFQWKHLPSLLLCPGLGATRQDLQPPKHTRSRQKHSRESTPLLCSRGQACPSPEVMCAHWCMKQVRHWRPSVLQMFRS